MKDPTLSPELDEIEFLPNADELTKQAVRAAAGHKPIHRTKRQKTKPKPPRKAKAASA